MGDTKQEVQLQSDWQKETQKINNVLIWKIRVGVQEQESKSGAIAIEAAVTGADVRSPLATSWLFDKRGLLVEIFSFSKFLLPK